MIKRSARKLEQKRNGIKVVSTTGFTLLELLVVIAIIGILSAIVIAALNNSRDKAKITQTVAQLKELYSAINLLYTDTGQYPHHQTNLCVPTGSLVANEKPLHQAVSGLVATDGAYPNWNGPYIGSVIDPWGTPYFFDLDYDCTPAQVGCRGKTFNNGGALVSCGPDKSVELPDLSRGCNYNSDNIVYVLCQP